MHLVSLSLCTQHPCHPLLRPGIPWRCLAAILRVKSSLLRHRCNHSSIPSLFSAVVALQPHKPALIDEATGEVRGHPVTLRHHVTMPAYTEFTHGSVLNLIRPSCVWMTVKPNASEAGTRWTIPPWVIKPWQPSYPGFTETSVTNIVCEYDRVTQILLKSV